MRFRLFLIFIGVVVLSLAGGLGLRFALAWTEPTATPPGDNVPAPINVGGTAQSKTGGLSIGGLFYVNGLSNGIVIGNPMPTGGDMGEGSLNAKKICINGDCLTSWAIANAFVQNGNSFGALATLGTNDNFDLAIETNNTERMRIDTAGNVGIGTTAPSEKLNIIGNQRFTTAGSAIYALPSAGYVTYLDLAAGGTAAFGNGAGIRIQSSGAGADGTISFTTNQGGVGNAERMRVTNIGNVGIGTTNPGARLEVYSARTASTNADAIILNDNVTGAQTDGVGKFIVSKSNGGASLSKIGFLETDGTNNNTSIAFYTAPTAGGLAERMRINQVGNIGIGTNNPLYKLVVAGASPREYIWPSGGGNPELDFGNVAGDSHWAVYRDLASDELRFWQNDNNVTMTAAGDLNSRRCFGPVYVGQTGAAYNGARGGYDDANALCAASVAGSHVCTTSEILETVKCNQASLPTTDQAWISNGPPGYTARANDCTGWTSTSPSGATTVYGAIWAFDASGGVGWVTTCNMTLKFACCR